MKEFELCIEAMTPCGGSKHARREILEVEAESPEGYVKPMRPCLFWRWRRQMEARLLPQAMAWATLPGIFSQRYKKAAPELK